MFGSFQNLKNLIFLMVIREWLRLFKEPSRMFGMMMQPLLFLGVFGLGFHNSFVLSANKNINYVSFFYPGILGLAVLFASIYSTLSLVEDKNTGFFSYVLLGPLGTIGAVMAKVVATLSLAFIQSLLFLPLLLLLPIDLAQINFLFLLLALLIGSLAFSILGVLMAWLSPSASSFHMLMSVILLPLWLLSGAMFPVDEGLLKWIAYINPMSFFISILRSNILSYGSKGNSDWFSLLFFAGLMWLILLKIVHKKPVE